MGLDTRDNTSIVSLFRSLWKNNNTILQLTKREATGRYKGSIIGLGWSFFNPVLMLSVYTFVFSFVFKSRWSDLENGSKFDFAIVMFVGMIIHTIFSEVLNKAPTIITNNINYVKKVVFPLEILPVVSLGASLFHAVISFGVLLIAFVMVNGFIHWTVIFIPLIVLPLALMSLGFAWIFSSLGVFIRDTGQTINILTTVMLFLAPVFYPSSALPEEYRILLQLNPLTFIIEQSRDVLIFGALPDWIGLFKYFLISSVVFWGGYIWFQKTRKGFADVV